MTQHHDPSGGDAVYKKDQVVSIINSVLSKVAVSNAGVEGHIYQEILVLKDVIETLRGDLRSAIPHDITRDHIPGATDELDAVVNLTEQATNTIMEACEAVQADITDLPDAVQEKITAHLVMIFEACTFQDITGQRIGKVIAALKKIDGKTKDVIQALEGHFLDSGVQKVPDDVLAEDDSQSLMNGPQLPGCGVNQDEIDRILQEAGIGN
jgi:chemotaxis protein CheZ